MNSSTANQEINKSIKNTSPRFGKGHMFNHTGIQYRIVETLIGQTITAYYCDRVKFKNDFSILEEKFVK